MKRRTRFFFLFFCEEILPLIYHSPGRRPLTFFSTIEEHLLFMYWDHEKIAHALLQILTRNLETMLSCKDAYCHFVDGNGEISPIRLYLVVVA